MPIGSALFNSVILTASKTLHSVYRPHNCKLVPQHYVGHPRRLRVRHGGLRVRHVINRTNIDTPFSVGRPGWRVSRSPRRQLSQPHVGVPYEHNRADLPSVSRHRRCAGDLHLNVDRVLTNRSDSVLWGSRATPPNRFTVLSARDPSGGRKKRQERLLRRRRLSFLGGRSHFVDGATTTNRWHHSHRASVRTRRQSGVAPEIGGAEKLPSQGNREGTDNGDHAVLQASRVQRHRTTDDEHPSDCARSLHAAWFRVHQLQTIQIDGWSRQDTDLRIPV